LLSLKHHAEQDKQHFLTLQSYLASKVSKEDEIDSRINRDLELTTKELKTAESFIKEEEKAVTACERQPVGSGDDLFLLEGVDQEGSGGRPAGSRAHVHSEDTSYSDDGEEGEQSEGDEGIHLPRSHRIKEEEIACSLPVRIPLQEQLLSHRNRDNIDEDQSNNIAASIQAMAKSVATSSMFGDPMFDLPRPRVNTFSKN